MVNVRQVKIFPIPDKTTEVRALLEEQAKSDSQAARTKLATAIECRGRDRRTS